jgi:TonB family protein
MPETMRYILAAVLVVFAATLHATPFAVNWDLAVDADGHVTKLATKDTSNPGVHAQLEQLIRGWRFSPAHVNGVAVSADTSLIVVLESTPASETTSTVRVVSASTGGRIGEMVPPLYPIAAARRSMQGRVLLRVHYKIDGKVIEVKPEEGVEQGDMLFVRSAEKAVRRWTFLPELVDGHALAGSSTVPLCYSLANSAVPPLDCSWRPAGGTVDMPSGESIAIEPAVRLLTDFSAPSP